MKENDIEKSRFWLYYLFGVTITSFLFIASLGPGLFNHDPSVWYLSWQRELFSALCHQLPSRSFYINGVQMAVCTRCFGIYSSVWIGSIIFPLISRAVKGKLTGGKVLMILSFLIIVIDFLGNLTGLWVNTNISRFFTGIFLGLSVTYFMSNEIFNKTNINLKSEGLVWNR